jgi:prepilin-type N-terminal cleavage/methylation domain-containing protein
MRGYTLIELVVVVGLMGILSLGLITVFFSSLRGNSLAQVEAEVKSQGDYGMALIERSLRGAVSAPTCSDAPPGVEYVGSDNVDKSYQLSDATQQLMVDGASSLFGQDIILSNVSFVCNPSTGTGLGSVTISFTLQADGKMNQTASETFQSTVAIRSTQ